ncbi:head maturation protease, ClpP-related [Novosphingobium olei]|uniref:head maturation protease, ClpP-related n=1 Tax=Novosphingobium olei TaxID=2728851 RepID=UPI00308544BF|nr:Clp protease ClpP [Novosphingobium olei]
MHRNKLLNLLAANARRGEFRAEAGDAGATIYLYDVIVSSKADAEWFGGVDAETFVQSLRGMQGDVSVRINCPGGDVFAARAMAQAIRDYPGQVTVYVDGYAASAATFLVAVADHVAVAQGGMIMVHKAWTIAMGNADDFRASAELLGKIDGTIADTYAAAAGRRGIDPADFTALMAAETWLTGEEAIALGLADEVAGDPGPNASARWDLSAYSNAPVAPMVQREPNPEAAIEPNLTIEGPAEAANSNVNDQIERNRRVAALRSRQPA